MNIRNYSKSFTLFRKRMTRRLYYYLWNLSYRTNIKLYGLEPFVFNRMVGVK